jgi:ATP-dependent Lhr-like helicase
VTEPSPFSHEILNANPYAFLDDAPLEERRSRAVSLRRGLPAEIVETLGALDLEAVAAVVEEAQPEAENPDELHDLLLDLGALPEADGNARGFAAHFQTLIEHRRAARLVGGADPLWVAAERRSLAALAWPDRRFEPDLIEPPSRRGAPISDRETAVVELARARLALTGPTTAAALAADLDLPEADLEAALAQVELTGAAMRGSFGLHAAGPEAVQWCDRRLLARINRRTLDRLRRDIEPVSASDFLRFLLDWQHVRPGTQLAGREGLLAVIGQLQGFEAAAGGWEREILALRVADYDPSWLDDLCLGGDVVWGRLECRPEGTQVPSRAAPIALAWRRDLGWLLGPRESGEGLSPQAAEVLAFLTSSGASFLEDIIAGARRLRAEVEDALWELVAAGRVTADGFAALRALLPAAAVGGGARRRWYGRWVRKQERIGRAGTGRWSVLRTPAPSADEDRVEALARQYVRRYGVVFRDLLRREPQAPPWRDLVRIYRRLEMRGELRGGRLVGGIVGEQFAAPEAVEALRAVRRRPKNGEVIALSACDPLNLVGLFTPGPRIPATLANTVTYRDGVPVDESGGEAHALEVVALSGAASASASG